jgi:hypothetical protein
MSQHREPNRTPQQLVEARVNAALKALNKIPHPRWSTTVGEKDLLLEVLHAAVEELRSRILTPQKAFTFADLPLSRSASPSRDELSNPMEQGPPPSWDSAKERGSAEAPPD